MVEQIFLVLEYLHDMQYKLHPTSIGLSWADARNMDVSVLWMLCVFRYISLRRADQSSRGIVQSVACLSVNSKPQIRGGQSPIRAVVTKEKKCFRWKRDFIVIPQTDSFEMYEERLLGYRLRISSEARIFFLKIPRMSLGSSKPFVEWIRGTVSPGAKQALR